MQRRLRRAMKRRSMTTTNLSHAAGLSATPICTLLAGSTSIRLDNLLAIADALQVRPGWLLDGGWWERLWQRETTAPGRIEVSATDAPPADTQ